MRSNRGFTVIELIMTLAMVALLAAIGLPRLTGTKASSDVRSAKAKIVSLYLRSRATAIETNRPMALRLSGATAEVMASNMDGTVDTLETRDLHADYGVSVSVNDPMLRIDPRGVGTGGASVTRIVVTKAGVADTILISGFGRVVSQ